MKKSLLSVFAVAAGLLMTTTSCSKQEEVTAGGEAVVTFIAQLPSGVNSRTPQRTTGDATTFGDGTKATRLQYAVYKVKTENNTTTWEEIADLGGETTLTNLTSTVSLQLVNGNTYAVAFWADATTEETPSIYSFDKENCKITATYTTTTNGGSSIITEYHASNDENLDAFYAVKTFTVNGSSQESVELKRPFAQLNIGTADLEAYEKASSKEIKQAGIKVNVPNVLNLKDGSVDGYADVTFAVADRPKAETFPITGYEYLTMNYLLMSEDKTADNTVTISYDNADERKFTNVPLQRNYRTNIYGNLLTSTTKFNVVIKPGFEKDDYNMEMTWDGKTTKEPTVDTENNVYVINTPSEWAYLCISEQNYATKSIELAADLDFGGHELGSIKLNGSGLYVDGKGHTIRNMKLVGDNKCISNLGTYCASLFCSPQGSTTIKALTVENAQVVCEHTDMDPTNPKGHAAVIFADLEPNANSVTLENVHVITADVYGIQPVAGLIGRNGKVPVKITDCSVENSRFHNVEMVGESGYVATLVGRTDDATTITIESTTSKDNTIDAYWAARRGENSIQEIAAEGIGITGVVAGGNTVKKTKVSPDVIVSTTGELVKALKQSYNSKIQLKAGTYSIDSNTGLKGEKTIQLVGESKENTILTITQSTTQDGTKLSFENLTMTNQDLISSAASNSYEFMFVRAAELNLTNCNVYGTFKTTATKTVIDGCTFKNTWLGGMHGYPIFLYANDLVVKNSEVTGVEKGILVYNEGAYPKFNVTVENCKFHATTANDKAAIEMHTEGGIYGNLTISGTTFDGFKTTVGAGAGLWNELNNNTSVRTTRFTVVVDGKTVQTASL